MLFKIESLDDWDDDDGLTQADIFHLKQGKISVIKTEYKGYPNYFVDVNSIEQLVKILNLYPNGLVLSECDRANCPADYTIAI